MEWNEDTIGKLRALWTEGHSTAEIGRRLGVSKNAVVGKAHRLSLTSRPSPIRRDNEGVPRRRQARRASATTLPMLAAALAPLPTAEPPAQAARPQTPAAERPPPMLRAVPATRPGTRVHPCCWPLGEPGTRSFRFCDDASVSGKPYCEQHAALAYVKVRDRREDAA